MSEQVRLNPNSEIGMGSARGSRAGLGGPPLPSSHILGFVFVEESLWDEVFRQPRKTARQWRALPIAGLRPVSTSELGLNA